MPPKRQNINKKAAAELQSQRAVQKAAPEAFLSVQSTKGNGFFTLRSAKGVEVRGTPRGLFTCGSMRISVGQIVVVEGDAKLGVEIVGVIQERHEAEQMVKKGRFPREVLTAAIGAGNIEGGPAEELDDLFEEAEEGEAYAEEGGKKGRRQAEAAAAIRARVELLSGGSTGPMPDVRIDDL